VERIEHKSFGKRMNMKKIGLLLFILLLGVSLQSWTDRVETTGGTVYEGQIIKIDENELVIKTSKGTIRIPRSNVKSFRSEPLPELSSSPNSTAATQSSKKPPYPSRFNILSDRVNVQAILTEYWTPLEPYSFDILVTHDRRQFETFTAIMGPRDIDEAVSQIIKSVGWKGNYLFVTSESGGNAWRCDVEHVFTIRQGQLIYIGSIQRGLDNEGEKPGYGYRNGYFFDVYDRLELSGWTSHASAPAIRIVMKEKGGHFIVDLERTWRENLSEYKQNLEDIKGLKDKKYDDDKDSVEWNQIAEIVLFNAVLAKYCRHQGELMQVMKETKSILKEGDKIIEVVLNEVVPGELPECEEKYDSCFHDSVTEIVQTLQPKKPLLKD
jgi:hypothetical protein